MSDNKYKATIDDGSLLNANFISEEGLNKQNISKRYYTVCAVIQGMLANGDLFNTFTSEDDIVKFAYSITDKLLKAEYS